MSKVNISDYPVLNLSGDNFLEWVMSTKIALQTRGLGRCITDGNHEIESQRQRAITIMRLHLTEELRDQYQDVKDPFDLWTILGERYSMVLWQNSLEEWETLSFQDFESVDEYNSVLMKIAHGLMLCGEVITHEDLLQKTISTFHPRELLLSHKAKSFTDYNDLFHYLRRGQRTKEIISRFDELMKRCSEMETPQTNDEEEASDCEGSSKVY